MLITEWNREGQNIRYEKDRLTHEALVTLSRVTYGGSIKHYLVGNNECGDFTDIIYENQVISVIEKKD